MMPYNILPFIIKRHGCIRYSKYVFLPKRQSATGSKKRPLQNAKVIAAPAATAPSQVVSRIVSEHYSESTVSNTSPEILSSVNGSLSSTITDEISESRDSVDRILPSHCSSFQGPALFFKNSNHYIVASESCCTNKQGELPLGAKKLPSHDVDILRAHYEQNNKHLDANPATVLVDAVKPSETDWHEQVVQLKLLPHCYMRLSKIRLTGLVVLTTVAGYGMACESLAPLTLLFTIIGTGLTSAAANCLNQFLEIPYDSQMSRTKNRVLVRGILTPLHAFTFALCSATLGLSTLYLGANGLTAALGAMNLVLYAGIYTPLKRCSIINTWVGSVVGAIPPVMGWAACTGSLSSGAVLMGAILYSWQFPHFNALSWNLRPDYSRAGYRMMSVINPLLCRRVALRHSIAILAFCSIAPLTDLTTWTFAIDSLPLNCYFVYHAWKFYDNADSQSSRKLFRLSLIYLPTLMLLMFIGKKRPAADDVKERNNVL